MAAPSPLELGAARNAFALLLQRYARNPLAFVTEVLGAEPDQWQRDVLAELGRGRTRISIRSGHGVGKTALLAWCMVWYLLTRFPVKVVCTAPTAPQLTDALWPELRSWLSKLPEAWLVLLDIQSDRVMLRAKPEDAFISARTSRAEQPDSLQGVHAKHVLLIVDEAAGVPEQVYEAAQGSMSTAGAVTILAGNPTKNTGMFWRSHTLEADRWYTRRVSCLDSPRADKAFAEEIANRYGTDSNRYRIRVLGEFPVSEGDTLINAGLVDEAMARLPELDRNQPQIWGVDVARFGSDQSVLIKRQGHCVLEPPRRWSQFDLMQLTGAIVSEYKANSENPPVAIVVDAIGLGAGVADRLRELKLPAIDCNVAESPANEGRFVRLRDELWQNVADWLLTRTVSLPYDEQLRTDLCAPRYGFSSDGKLRVESKDQMRQRGVQSPDSADALCLSHAPAAYIAAAYASTRLSQPIRRNIRGVL